MCKRLFYYAPPVNFRHKRTVKADALSRHYRGPQDDKSHFIFSLNGRAGVRATVEGEKGRTKADNRRKTCPYPDLTPCRDVSSDDDDASSCLPPSSTEEGGSIREREERHGCFYLSIYFLILNKVFPLAFLLMGCFRTTKFPRVRKVYIWAAPSPPSSSPLADLA